MKVGKPTFIVACLNGVWYIKVFLVHRKRPSLFLHYGNTIMRQELRTIVGKNGSANLYCAKYFND